jgi:hypothetical protein
MALVLVCPQCQAKVVLQSQSCPFCQADLRNVPQDRRRYVIGQPGPSTPPAAPAPATEPIPVIEAAKLEAKVRRPHVRRYAAPPVSETHPVSSKSAKTQGASAAAPKTEAKKAKKAQGSKKKK